MFEDIRTRFSKLYKRKAHLYHYTEWMDAADIQHAHDSVRDLIQSYASMDSSV